MSKWWDANGNEAEKAATWAGRVIVSAGFAWLAKVVTERVSRRSQAEMVAKEVLGENPSSSSEKLRDIVEEVRSDTKTNTTLREKFEQTTAEGFREVRGAIQDLRTEMNQHISELRTEQGKREERQEKRIDNFLQEIRHYALRERV